jgi:hypothetical protein
MRTLLGITFGIFALTCAFSLETSAQNRQRPRGINSREHNQAQRLRQGVRSGELTARETGRLAREQVQIRRMEERFRESGNGLNSRERVRLQRELNQSSRHIYRQKHDRQDYPRGRKTP